MPHNPRLYHLTSYVPETAGAVEIVGGVAETDPVVEIAAAVVETVEVVVDSVTDSPLEEFFVVHDIQ